MKDESKEATTYYIVSNDDVRIYSYSVIDNTEEITLQQAIKEKANLTTAKLEGYNLDGVDLTKGKLNDCVFKSCSLVGAKFNGTRCARAEFKYVNMDMAYIVNQELFYWKFTNSQLTNINFGELDLTDCKFDGVDFAGSDLSKAKYYTGQFDNCYLDGTKMNPNIEP